MIAGPLLAALDPPPRRVALFRPGRLGDFVCATPTVRALRAALPGAELTMIVLPALVPLAERLQHVDRCASFPGAPGIAEQLFDARRTLAFLADMQAERFDLAIQMYESGVHSNPLTLMFAARVTAGFCREDGWSTRLDAALPIPRRGHEVDRLLALALFLGAEPRGRETEFPLLPEDRAAAEHLLAGVRARPVILHPGGADPSRRWPERRFRSLAASLAADGHDVFVIGSPAERPLAERVARAAGARGFPVAGRATSVVGAIVERAAALVGPSSGPAHVAYALGTPTVTLLGDADRDRYGPPPGPHRTLPLGAGEELVVARLGELIGTGSSTRPIASNE